MKCLVAVKRVVDFNVKIQVKSDLTGVITDHVKMSLNPFDEIALEEAVLQKEKGILSEIVVVTIGLENNQDILRAALARGADRAILVTCDQNELFMKNGFLEPFNIATILKAIVAEEKPDLILMGKQSIDGDNNQTGQMLTGLLGWSQGTFASKMFIQKEKNAVTVTREVDAGLEIVELKCPTIITADLRLNEPRYIALPNVMKAKTKPLKTVSLTELNVTLKPHVKIIKVEPPPKRKVGIKVANVQELVDNLQKQKVL